MSKPKHTPGPWKVETYHGAFFKIIGPTPKSSAEILPRTEADAALIAAAPELLEALRKAEELMSCLEWDGEDQTEWDETIMAAHNAIAKAEGTENE